MDNVDYFAMAAGTVIGALIVVIFCIALFGV